MEQFGPHARHKIRASIIFLMTIQCHVHCREKIAGWTLEAVWYAGLFFSGCK